MQVWNVHTSLSPFEWLFFLLLSLSPVHITIQSFLWTLLTYFMSPQCDILLLILPVCCCKGSCSLCKYRWMQLNTSIRNLFYHFPPCTLKMRSCISSEWLEKYSCLRYQSLKNVQPSTPCQNIFIVSHRKWSLNCTHLGVMIPVKHFFTISDQRINAA